MNKKLLVVSILAVFMLLAISMASAVNATTPIKKKESPLYGIRTRLAIRDKIKDLREQIKTKYIGDRVFYLPFQLLKYKLYQEPTASIVFETCVINPCTWEDYCYTCAAYCLTHEKQCTFNQYTC